MRSSAWLAGQLHRAVEMAESQIEIPRHGATVSSSGCNYPAYDREEYLVGQHRPLPTHTAHGTSQ